MRKPSEIEQITPQDSLSSVLKSAYPGMRILLSPGIYREKIEITVPGIQLIGHSAEDTKLVFDD